MTDIYDMTMNMEEVKKRIDDGLINVRKHPFLDLWIYNYGTRTQYKGLWDEYTERCRGLIVDKNGHILNNPFRKFFNLGEKEYTKIENLPFEIPKITEKIDGMLGILYEEGGKVAISTRGSFDSPFAIWATNWIRTKGYSLGDFKNEYTYLFDIIYPDNKIIVDYKDRAELVLLAVRNNFSEEELDHIKEAQRLGFSYANEYHFDKIEDAVKYLENLKGSEFEGFVIKFSNGLRIKIKSADYKRLHKLSSGVSAGDIWRSLRDTGSVESIIENVPDEFMQWVKNIEMKMKVSKMEIMTKAMNITLDAKKLEKRIDQFNYISMRSEKDYGYGIRKIAIFLLDGHVSKAEFAAWQLIKPSGEVFKIER
jgi:RNA ligase